MITSVFQVCLNPVGLLCGAHSQYFVHMDESTLIICMIYFVDDEMHHFVTKFYSKSVRFGILTYIVGDDKHIKLKSIKHETHRL